MDRFVLSQKLSALTRDEVDNLSSPWTITEAESVVKTLLRKRYPGLVTVNSTERLEEKGGVLYRLSQEIEGCQQFPTHVTGLCYRVALMTGPETAYGRH